MKTGKFLLIGSVVVTLGLASCTRMDNVPTPPNDYTLNGIDVEFMTKANHDHHREIKIGYYASINGTDQDVRDYGAKMVAEHQAALVELQALAGKIGLDLLHSPSYEQNKNIDYLVSLQLGTQFDQIYAAFERTYHQEALTLYNKEIKTGNHNLVQEYASKYYSEVQSHLGVTP